MDSSSPVVWDLEGGRNLVHILTSFGGQPSLATGLALTGMGTARPVTFVTHPGDGIWMESVIPDEGGTWYGYYHNEVPAAFCGRPDRTLPRIGAARSHDQGRTWEDLGIILEAPAGWHDCGTRNEFFVGGVGDLSAILDRDSTDLYIFFSQYSRVPSAQGVAVARLPWANRDEPVGQVQIWSERIWLPAEGVPMPGDEEGDTEQGSGSDSGDPAAGSEPSEDGEDEGGQEEPSASDMMWLYPPGTPLVPVTRPWHDADSGNNAFWGATVHWNTHLEQYVMLLNRTKDDAFGQEGVYVSFAPRLDDPALWTAPARILSGGRWYPQVIGLEPGTGSDRVAGARARFFMSGTSTEYIDFSYR